MGYASTNNSLLPNTWQLKSPWMELALECMVSITILHCSILTLNIQSARYLRLSGIMADYTRFFVVAFSVSAARVTLIPNRLLKSSAVVFKC